MMNNKSIFISRELRQNALWATLVKLGYLVHSESLLALKPISFSFLPNSDWLYFYSQNAVKFFHEECNKKNIDLDTRKFAAHGPQTAFAIQTYFNIAAEFVYNPNTDSDSSTFQNKLAGTKVLFIQATNSRETIQEKSLNLNFEILEIYSNTPKSDIHVPSSKYLLFTSPLNASTYFSKYKYQEGQYVIAIGSTTLAACLKYSNPNMTFKSDKCSEKSMFEKLIQILV